MSPSVPGINTVIIGSGMKDVHSVNEYIIIEDLYRTAKIIIGLMTHDE